MLVQDRIRMSTVEKTRVMEALEAALKIGQGKVKVAQGDRDGALALYLDFINLFQFLLVTGCLLLICLQAIINLGVVTGLFPTKGMSLPFISAGLSNLMLMGLLLGVGMVVDNAVVAVESIYQQREKFPDDPPKASVVGVRNVAIALSAAGRKAVITATTRPIAQTQ